MHGSNDRRPTPPTIVAIDLGKFNSVACIFERAAAAHRFVTLTSTPRAIHDLLAHHDPDHTEVVFETCDASGWVHDVVTAMGFAHVRVANPAHEAWRWTKVKRKTDRDDALKLARLTAMNQLPTVHMPSPTQRQTRRLVHHRHTLVGRQTQVKNQVHSILSQQGIRPRKGLKSLWTREGRGWLEELATPMGSCTLDELWRGRLHVELQLLDAIAQQLSIIQKKLDTLAKADARVTLLQTVPGVGVRLAEAVVAHLDDPGRFATGRQVACYAGLVPKQFDSGTMKRSGRITRRGPALLRGLLVEVAWQVHRYNPWGRAFVDRVSRGQKVRRKTAIVALARKLLVTLWAMLRDGTPWRQPAPLPGATV